MTNRNTSFNFKDWILTGWGAAIIAIIVAVSGLLKTGYEWGQYVSESDHKNVVTNMRIDFQEKVADIKEKAEESKKQALKDLAEEKQTETDKLYSLLKSNNSKR